MTLFKLLLKVEDIDIDDDVNKEVLLQRIIDTSMKFMRTLFPSMHRIDNETAASFIDDLVIGITFEDGYHSLHEMTVEIDEKDVNRLKLVDPEKYYGLLNYLYVAREHIHGTPHYRNFYLKLEIP